jgi:hypothetical protein
MPVPARDKCPKCRGETDVRQEACLACAFHKEVKILDGAKHVPAHYFDGQEQAAEDRRRRERSNRHN